MCNLILSLEEGVLMAITKLTHAPEITPTNTTHIRFICPICKSSKSLPTPRSIVDKSKGMTTMSIASGLVCEHQFQAFVDKNFVVRGYQRVDFEFEKTKTEQRKKPENYVKNDKELFENLILEGNYLEYNPKKNHGNKLEPISKKKKKKPIQEIYDEFWEFIDENNETFKKFIENDIRRNGKGGNSQNTREERFF